MRRIPLIVAALAGLGCGPAGPEASEPSPGSTADAAVDPAAELRLGCDRIAAADIEAEARQLARAAGAAPDDPAGTGLRTEARSRLVRRRITRREAERLGLDVSAEELDAAVARIRLQNNLDDPALIGELERLGYTLAAYRDEVRDQILELKVLSLLTPVEITEADVQAEYLRFAAELGEENAPPLETVHDGLWSRVLDRRLQQAADAFFAERQARLERVETRTEFGRCVEAWPSYEAWEVKFEGNAALTDDELREAVRQALGPEGRVTTEFDPAGEIGPFVLAAYLDRGYLGARLESVEDTGRGLVARLTEGEPYRLGAVRVAVRAADGTEAEPEGGEASWRPLLALQPGDAFARRTFGEFLQALRTRYEAEWGAGNADVYPDLTLGEHKVDVRVVISRIARE